MKCCGIYGPADWNGVFQNDQLPGSCCQREAGAQCSMVDGAFKEGCKTKFIDYLKSNIVLVAGVGIGVAVVQVCVYICAII